MRYFLLFSLAVALPGAMLAEQPIELRRFTPGEPLSGVLLEYEAGPSHWDSLINRPAPVFQKYKANIERYPRSGRYFYSKTSLSGLMQRGFGVKASRLIGPEWISRTSYEVYFETEEPTCDSLLILRQLREKFGAKLTADTEPTEFLIIDSAERIEPARWSRWQPVPVARATNAKTSVTLSAVDTSNILS